MQPEDVTLTSDLADLDKVREHFGLESAALLGHSWGAVLALEYALRRPARVSHMILMNPAPASASDVAVFRTAYVRRLGADMDRQREILASAAYTQEDSGAVTARYGLHFKPALKRPDDYEKLPARMKAGFISQGPEGIVKARAVEDRLMRDTWQVDGYDLLPRLRDLRIPTLVIWGDHDFIPSEIAMHIAGALPDAQMVTLRDCGHFVHLECPGDVRIVLDDFFRRTAAGGPRRSAGHSPREIAGSALPLHQACTVLPCTGVASIAAFRAQRRGGLFVGHEMVDSSATSNTRLACATFPCWPWRAPAGTRPSAEEQTGR